jgi:hypothetical protein
VLVELLILLHVGIFTLLTLLLLLKEHLLVVLLVLLLLEFSETLLCDISLGVAALL